MSDAWPKRFLSSSEGVPETIPWRSIESHERSRALLLVACREGKLQEAASLLAREWNISTITTTLIAHVQEAYQGSVYQYQAHLQSYPAVSEEFRLESFSRLQTETLLHNPKERWRFDPEVNFVARYLLSTKAPLAQIAAILARFAATPGNPTLDTLHQMVQRNGREGSGVFLAHNVQPVSQEREQELVEEAAQLLLLTPQKDVSVWFSNPRARALCALLLSFPDIPPANIRAALETYCGTGTVSVASITKPLSRWKKTMDNPSENPRASYAEALSKECVLHSRGVYEEMISIAEQVVAQFKEDGPVRDLSQLESQKLERRKEKVAKQSEKLRTMLLHFQRFPPVVISITQSSRERMSFPPFAALIDAIRKRRGDVLQTAHVHITFTQEAYKMDSLVDSAILCPAVTVSFNSEGGTRESRVTASRVRRYVIEEVASMRKQKTDHNVNALYAAMMAPGPGIPPLLRFSWRETDSAWTAQAKARRLPGSEKRARNFQVPLSRLERLFLRDTRDT